LAYSADQGEDDPLAQMENSELAYAEVTSPLGERLAALKAEQQPQSTTYPEGVDPLTELPIDPLA
jgi:hypothetical protein